MCGSRCESLQGCGSPGRLTVNGAASQRLVQGMALRRAASPVEIYLPTYIEAY